VIDSRATLVYTVQNVSCRKCGLRTRLVHVLAYLPGLNQYYFVGETPKMGIKEF